MFFVVWLPLVVFFIAFLIFLINSIQDKDFEIAFVGFFRSIWYGILTAIFSLFFGSILFWVDAPAHAYVDSSHPQYLAQIPGGYDSPKYVISTESLASGENLTYYLLDKNNQPLEESNKASSIRTVEEDGSEAFILEIKYTCDGDKLWVLYCLNPSPYRYELHLPLDSIIYMRP